MSTLRVETIGAPGLGKTINYMKAGAKAFGTINQGTSPASWRISFNASSIMDVGAAVTRHIFASPMSSAGGYTVVSSTTVSLVLHANYQGADAFGQECWSKGNLATGVDDTFAAGAVFGDLAP